MTIEESGPPGPKAVRLLYFVGAGLLCTVAINMWRDYERKSLQQKQQQSPIDSPTATAIHKALD